MNSRKQGNGPSPTPRGAAQRSSGAKGGDIFRRVASLVKDFTVLLSVVGGSLLIHEFLRRFMPAPSDYEQFTGGFSTQGDPSVQKQTDPYAVLKIADGSDLEVAKKSYRKLALIYHPVRDHTVI